MSTHLASLRARFADARAALLGGLPDIEGWMREVPPSATGLGRAFFIEVAFQAGAAAGDCEIEPPPGLSRDEPWYWIGFARQTPQRSGVVFWFSPSPSLDTLRDNADWQHGNILGFDFVATSDAELTEMLSEPLCRDVIGAFAPLTPAAVQFPTED